MRRLFAVAGSLLVLACGGKDAAPPADQAQTPAPQSERFPPRCTLSNGTSVVRITLDNGPADPINAAESVSGLGDAAYLERLDPNSKGEMMRWRWRRT